MKPQNEFRCFCSEHGALLVGACQRDRFSHYPFLLPARSRLLGLLEKFVRTNLGAAALTTAVQLPRRVVVDAYVDAEEKVHLIDIAPFHDATDPLLFEWPELVQAANNAERFLHKDDVTTGNSASVVELRVAATSAHAVRSAIKLVVKKPAPPTVGPAPKPELRLVETEHGIAPSASIYYGWPEDLRESGGSDVSALLESAKKAASSNAG